MCDIFKKVQNYQEWAPLILRVVAGAFFIAHGAMKFWGANGLSGFTGWMASMGVPAWLAFLVPFFELVGGALLVIGLFTRYATIPLGVIMIVAAIMAHLPNGIMDAEKVIVFLAVFVSLFFTGAGKWSIDTWHEACKAKKASQ